MFDETSGTDEQTTQAEQVAQPKRRSRRVTRTVVVPSVGVSAPPVADPVEVAADAGPDTVETAVEPDTVEADAVVPDAAQAGAAAPDSAAAADATAVPDVDVVPAAEFDPAPIEVPAASGTDTAGPGLDVLAELAGLGLTSRPPASSGRPRLASTAVLFQAPDPAARPRRRRATSRSGSPEEISSAVVHPTAAHPTPEPAPEAEPAPAARGGRRRGRRAAGEPVAPPADALLTADGTVDDEQEGAPGVETSGAVGEAARPDDASDDLEGTDLEPDGGSGDEPEDGTDDTEPGERGRRRRRRSGRGRRRGGERSADAEPGTADEVAAEPADDEAAEAEDDQTGEPGESGGSRRRRRRRRSGRSEEAGERADDQVTALRGSTRLEAKRQRRRDGRDAGRRRQIITEAEFLARRESVERLMVVREVDGRTQIAVLEDGILVEHYVSNQAQASTVGNVYLGRVQNVLPSMEAAFVDVGKGRNAVLYAGEVNWDAAGLDGQPRRIEQALKSGDSVLVQVTKDPIGHKGARLTSQVTLAGRYLVLVPGGGMTGISHKLPDPERNRLKKVLRAIVPESAGVIVRTAAEGATEAELAADIERLQAQWEAISAKARTASAPALLQGEPDMAIRVVRDIFNDDFAGLVVAGEQAWRTISGYVAELAPDLAGRVTRWTSDADVFAQHRVDEQLAKGMDRKVWLPSGGSLIIDRTEAMTVIDVNTGKFTGAGGTLEETVTRNNLEAAEEIVRQLRLRDIGGMIVVDFIDMVLESNRDLVLRRLVEALGRDRTKHQVAEVTSLGLVQMTRKRVGQGLVEAFSETCEHCHGRGFVVHAEPVERARTEPVGEPEPGPRRGARRRRDEPVAPLPSVPVLPEAREAVKATLATIAAAAAHAHESAHPSDGEPADAPVDQPAPGEASVPADAGPDGAPVPADEAPDQV